MKEELMKSEHVLRRYNQIMSSRGREVVGHANKKCVGERYV